MKVSAIIVTYANRFRLLEQVVASCLIAKVDDIIVVDNNSDTESKNKIEQLADKQTNLQVIWNSKNLGSAKAYQQGLQKASKLDNDFIWLLDDDNLPGKNTLTTLKDFWKKKSEDTSALLCYRPDRPQYKKAVALKDSSFVLGLPNSFSGFHFKDKIQKVFKPSLDPEHWENHGAVDYAPYGGLFFNKNLLSKIGYPNEDLYLYSDDHDWTYRITQNGEKIMLILDALLEDIDTSWAVKKRGNYFQNIKNAPAKRVYYSIRNRMWFERHHLVKSAFIYCLNYWIFKLLMVLICYRHANYKIFTKAVADGRNDKLGQVL